MGKESLLARPKNQKKEIMSGELDSFPTTSLYSYERNREVVHQTPLNRDLPTMCSSLEVVSVDRGVW